MSWPPIRRDCPIRAAPPPLHPRNQASPHPSEEAADAPDRDLRARQGPDGARPPSRAPLPCQSRDAVMQRAPASSRPPGKRWREAIFVYPRIRAATGQKVSSRHPVDHRVREAPGRPADQGSSGYRAQHMLVFLAETQDSQVARMIAAAGPGSGCLLPALAVAARTLCAVMIAPAITGFLPTNAHLALDGGQYRRFDWAGRDHGRRPSHPGWGGTAPSVAAPGGAAVSTAPTGRAPRQDRGGGRTIAVMRMNEQPEERLLHLMYGALKVRALSAHQPG